MKKVALIDETGGGQEGIIVLSLVYFPDDGKTLYFDEFNDDVSNLHKKVSARFTNITKPLIGMGLEFPEHVDDFFSADVICSKEKAYKISSDKQPFAEALKQMGYHTISGYRHGVDKISIKEIKSRL